MKVLNLTLLFTAILFVPLVASGDDPTPINIQVSPNVIAIRSSGTWLTIHADIPCETVVASSVELDAAGTVIAPTAVFADDCGNLVAKFPLNMVKDAVKGLTSADMTLSGTTTLGADFSGTATVAVK